LMASGDEAALPVAQGIAAAAALIALGNMLSRVLGQVRESVTAALFGADAGVSAYTIASAVPTQIYDLLVAGLVTAALVPVFSGYAERDRAALWRVASSVFNLTLLSVGLLAALLWLVAPNVARLLAPGFANDPELLATTIRMIRWMLGAVLFMSLSGLITALLQAQRRFLLPAFTTAVFNIGIIVGALVWRRIGVEALAIGMLLGAVAQVALQLPGLRGARYLPRLGLSDPEVHQVLRLYWPVALGTAFSLIGTLIDRRLATLVGLGAAAYMRYATTLIQFALGLIAAAIALAALPTLARQNDDDPQAFKQTLSASIKAVLLLILPATALLAVLARPVVTILFEHGQFNAADARVTSLALLLYLPSLAAAAVDQLLIFAFYAQRRTLLPNLVQGAAVGCYLLVALSLVGTLGMWGLIMGNVAQWVAHVLIMLVLGARLLGGWRGQRLGEALWKGLLASLVAGFAAAAVVWPLAGVAGKLGALLQLLAGGVSGALVYAALCARLRVELWGTFVGALQRRLGRA
jgi:putative peptidoglycan lipid II flippase